MWTERVYEREVQRVYLHSRRHGEHSAAAPCYTAPLGT